jgi:hypothetical protein
MNLFVIYSQISIYNIPMRQMSLVQMYKIIRAQPTPAQELILEIEKVTGRNGSMVEPIPIMKSSSYWRQLWERVSTQLLPSIPIGFKSQPKLKPSARGLRKQLVNLQ